MSSPAGLQLSQTHFLAQWMPSSSRAGVILNPSPDLAESLRYSSTWDSRDTEDSFSSHFAPLPASRSSSCLSVHAIGSEESGTDLNLQNHRPRERILSDKQASQPHGASPRSAGETNSMDEMISQSQELPLTLKLDQLRQWQKHMQEQLKAQQLEELLRLQEEQQRLLGLAKGGREGPGEWLCTTDCTGSLGLTGSDWGESTIQNPETLAPRSPPLKAPANWRQGNDLQGAPQDQKQVGPEDRQDTLGTQAWNYRDQEQSVDDSCEEQDVTAHSASSRSEHHSVEKADEAEADPEDRPIKPGIGGQKRTFEELLEEQLRLEDQRAGQLQQQSPESTEGMRDNPKRAFLKRGEGLSRFTNPNKASVPNRGGKKHPQPQPQVKVNVPRTSEPRTLKKAGVNQRPPVQRKTAVLNKENRPRIPLSTPQEPRVPLPAGARVLGAHQRQNTDPLNTDPPSTKSFSQRVQLKEASNMKPMRSSQPATVNKPSEAPPRLVTKQVGLRESPGTSDKGSVSSVRNTAEGNLTSVGILQDSFEVSFQEKLRRWESERQTESVELGEFELLEQAAEELSFSSNSSFVAKVLQLDRQQHRHLQGSRGGQPHRLSSTPIKSPRPSPPKGPEGREGARGSFGCGAPAETGEEFLRSTATAGDDHYEEEEEKDDVEGQGTKPDVSNISLHSSSEFGDEVVAGSSHVPTFPGSLCFSSSNPPYDKRSYQDQGTVESSGRGREEEEDDHSMVSSNPDDSTLLEDKEDQGHLVFDDDDTWNDPEETGGAHADSLVPAATANNLTSPERMLTRKVAMVKGAGPDRGGAMGITNQEQVPPPSSQLMTRLFPTLKPKTPPALPPPVEARHTEQGAGQQGQQSRQLRERLVELELEIERFRKENSALAKLRQENEQNQESLRKERAEFEQRKAEELARFEEFRKEETRRLQKERQVFEKHASAARAIPDKKERQEIQSLKQQLSSLQEELRRRESRWSTTHSRLRQQVESLSSDNSSLREEVRTLERLRLSTWKSSQADAAKDRKDKPGFFQSSGGNKMVTFASPPESMRSSPPQISQTTGGSPGGSSSSSPSAGGIRSSLKRSSPPRSPEGSAGQGGSPGAGGRSEGRSLGAGGRSEGGSPGAGGRSEGGSPGAGGRSKGGSPGAGGRSEGDSLNQEHSLNLSPDVVCVQQRAGGQQTEEGSKVEQQPSQEVLTHPDGKTERLLPCGGRLILFPNGTRKELSADGHTAKVTFFNGDIKQVLGDQRVVYYYAEAQTTHTTYPDGMEVLQFPNNQTEKHFPDGRKEITFPDQTIKNLFPDGKEESVLTDGTVVQVNPDGTKVIRFITGQREVHTPEYKCREYPDGTVKTVFTDGRQETRYPTGRVRVKDKDGNVVMDN